MILFFFGEDTFRLREKRLVLKDAFFKKNPDSSGFFEFALGETPDLQPIQAVLGQAGLFASKKFVTVGNVFDAPLETRRTLAEFLDEQGESLSVDEDRIILFWQNGIPKKNEKLWKALTAKYIRTETFDTLQGVHLLRWIDTQVKHSGASGIEPHARKLLSESYFQKPKKSSEKKRIIDMFRLDTEIQKLGSYRRNELIRVEDIYLLSTPPASEESIFQALDTLFSGSRSDAVIAFMCLAKDGDVLGLLGMCAWQLRNIIRTKGALDDGRIRTSMEAAKLLGMHPFPAEKCFRIAQRSTRSEIEASFTQLVRLDREAKSGDRNPEDALMAFVSK